MIGWIYFQLHSLENNIFEPCRVWHHWCFLSNLCSFLMLKTDHRKKKLIVSALVWLLCLSSKEWFRSTRHEKTSTCFNYTQISVNKLFHFVVVKQQLCSHVPVVMNSHCTKDTVRIPEDENEKHFIFILMANKIHEDVCDTGNVRSKTGGLLVCKISLN